MEQIPQLLLLVVLDHQDKDTPKNKSIYHTVVKCWAVGYLTDKNTVSLPLIIQTLLDFPQSCSQVSLFNIIILKDNTNEISVLTCCSSGVKQYGGESPGGDISSFKVPGNNNSE